MEDVRAANINLVGDKRMSVLGELNERAPSPTAVGEGGSEGSRSGL